MNSRKDDTALQVSLGPLKLKNPVMAASGTFGYGEAYAPLIPLKKLGAIVTKGLSLEPRKGNPPPRLAETPAGMLNAIGLENVGLKAFLREKLPKLRRLRCPILVNIFGNTLEEYAEIARRLGDVEGIAGLEVNISCPNLKAGGSIFAADPRSVLQVTSKVRQATSAFLLVKLSPNVADIGKIAQAAEEGGANAVSLINTLVGLAIDIRTRTPILGNITGGLSGPAIKPVALYMVYRVAEVVKVPIVGCGGISNAYDALEFLMAGASAIEVGTSSFTNPRSTIDVLEGIEKFLAEQKINTISEIIGAARAK